MASTEPDADGHDDDASVVTSVSYSIAPHVSPSADNLAFIDMEMTGLGADDQIMEIAVIVTTPQLIPIPEASLHLILHVDDDVLFAMGDWCKEHHSHPREHAENRSLVDLCKESTLSLSEAEEMLRTLFDSYRNGYKMLLCGSSVAIDRFFLLKYMPSLDACLHFRTIDVSGMLELARRMYPGVDHFKPRPHNPTAHCAMQDIANSLELMRWVRNNLFVPYIGAQCYGNYIAAEILFSQVSSQRYLATFPYGSAQSVPPKLAFKRHVAEEPEHDEHESANSVPPVTTHSSSSSACLTKPDRRIRKEATTGPRAAYWTLNRQHLGASSSSSRKQQQPQQRPPSRFNVSGTGASLRSTKQHPSL